VTDLCLEGGEIAGVLDVGTGTGLFAESFSNHGLQVSGLDANPEMLAAARQFVPEGKFHQGTAEELPYSDRSTDLVFLGLVLHEADETLEALKEARRIARKRVCILEWPFRDGPIGPPLAHRLKLKDLARLFRKAGFRKWQKIDLINTVLYRLEI
jgi:ubiquinone/menaquinone biosynthesis C-methylase UbiE